MKNIRNVTPTASLAPSQPELSVVIPVFNENHTIEGLLNDWGNFLNEELSDYEILVINDGSLDGTSRILDKMRQTNRRIRVIHQLNSGHCRAIRRGYEESRGIYILQADAGGRYEPIDAKELLEARRTHQLVLGYRTHRLDSLFRRGCSWVLKNLLKMGFKLEVEDANIPFRLFRREAALPFIKTLPANATATNLLLTVQMMRAYPGGTAQIPVPYRPRVGLGRRLRYLNLLFFGAATAFQLIRLRIPTLKVGIFSASPKAGQA